MEIKNLEGTPLPVIVDCLLDAFTGYYVQMPSNPDYWKERFKAARVDLSLSFGMFEDGNLIGFIINGVDLHNRALTAFNTGTGVRPVFRSKKVVDRLYEFALPRFKEKNIQKCMLEVICENERAIKVYERIGFSVNRRLNCFKGNLNLTEEMPQLSATSPDEILKRDFGDEKYYTWDQNEQAMRAAGDIYEHYLVSGDKAEIIGYFSINPKIGYVARLFAESGSYSSLLNGIAGKFPEIKVNNIDEDRQELVRSLLAFGLENHIDQFEMEMRF